MKTCRACLCTDKELFRVDESFILNYNSLTNLNVKRFDGLPELFCRLCRQAVNSFIEFRDKCISSESTLQEKSLECKSIKLIQHPEFEHNLEVDIKKEQKEDFGDTCQYELFHYDVKAEAEGTNEECIVIIDKEPMKETASTVVKVTKRRRFKYGVKKRKKTAGAPIANKQPKTIDENSEELLCGLCDKSFMCCDSLNKHIDSHRADTNCSICSKLFENWPKLLAHRVMHSKKKICHLCPRRFHSLYNLEQHYLTVHYEDQVAELSCVHCPKKFTCPRKLSVHAETHNIDCHLCPEVFANRHLLNTHLRTHDPKSRYACDMCEYTAVYASVLANKCTLGHEDRNLKEHVRKLYIYMHRTFKKLRYRVLEHCQYHKKRKHKMFACKICDRKFADSARLKDHACMDKSKICPTCGKRIFESFTRHLKIHEDTKNFKCDRCPASFKYQMSLKTHIDRHEDNRTFSCDYCGRKFFTSTTLNKHRRIHTGERPYACEKCGKRFTGNSNLKLHMQTHGIMLINKRSKQQEPSTIPLPDSNKKSVTEPLTLPDNRNTGQ